VRSEEAIFPILLSHSNNAGNLDEALVSIPGIAITRLASRMPCAEGSGAACRLQKVLLQIDKRYYIAVICIFG
jgi:hypothetical protein